MGEYKTDISLLIFLQDLFTNIHQVASLGGICTILYQPCKYVQARIHYVSGEANSLWDSWPEMIIGLCISQCVMPAI